MDSRLSLSTLVRLAERSIGYRNPRYPKPVDSDAGLIADLLEDNGDLQIWLQTERMTLQFLAREMLEARRASELAAERANELIARLERKSARLERENESLQNKSLEDPLTGLGNKSYFNAMLVEAHRDREPACVILIDGDGFRELNTKRGHAWCDKLLILTGILLGSCVREGDGVTRWGGDEFAIVLKNCSLEKAAEIAERMRDAVETASLALGIGYRISVGVAAVDKSLPNENLPNLIAASVAYPDLALYAAKGVKNEKTLAGAQYVLPLEDTEKPKNRVVALVIDTDQHGQIFAVPKLVPKCQPGNHSRIIAAAMSKAGMAQQEMDFQQPKTEVRQAFTYNI